MNLSKKSEKAIDIAGRIMSAVLVTSAAELYRKCQIKQCIEK